MSVSRFDLRKGVVLEEANAIGTTYLRAGFLDEPFRSDAKALLRRYVDACLEFFAAGADAPRARNAEAELAQLQGEIWSRAAAVMRRDPRAVATGLFIQSLNETIDLDAKQLADLENHVPDAVWLMVFSVAGLAVLTAGCGCGLGSRRNLLSNLVMPLAIAAVPALAIDLDRPRQGLIRVGQASLVRLRSSMSSPL